MNQLPKRYTNLELLISNEETQILRVFDNELSKTRLLKFIGGDSPTKKQIALLKKDFEIGSKFKNCEYVTKYISLERFEDNFYIVMEDEQYSSLSTVFQKVGSLAK